MKTLETDRLILREWTLEDVDDVYEYGTEEHTGPMAGWKPHDSKRETERIIQMFMEENETWAIVLKETGRVIGSVGLHTDNRRGLVYEEARMLGYVISEKYWGMGIVPEASRKVLEFAFEELGIKIVSVVHFPENTRSKRVIEKLGFKYEGTIRMASIIFDGSVKDDVCYSMTKEEWIQGNTIK